jgi:Fe2+ transport system protein B
VILAGNKADLTNARVVSMDSVIDLATRFGINSVETSALSGQAIENVFESVIEKYLNCVPSISAAQDFDTL